MREGVGLLLTLGVLATLRYEWLSLAVSNIKWLTPSGPATLTKSRSVLRFDSCTAWHAHHQRVPSLVPSCRPQSPSSGHATEAMPQRPCHRHTARNPSHKPTGQPPGHAPARVRTLHWGDTGLPYLEVHGGVGQHHAAQVLLQVAQDVLQRTRTGREHKEWLPRAGLTWPAGEACGHAACVSCLRLRNFRAAANLGRPPSLTASFPRRTTNVLGAGLLVSGSSLCVRFFFCRAGGMGAHRLGKKNSCRMAVDRSLGILQRMRCIGRGPRDAIMVTVACHYWAWGRIQHALSGKRVRLHGAAAPCLCSRLCCCTHPSSLGHVCTAIR